MLNSEKRIDYLKQKYWKKIVEVFPDNPEAIWDNLIRQSASTNHKYLDWLVAQVLNERTLLIGSDDDAEGLLKCFHDRKQDLAQRDINSYTFNQLHEALAKTEYCLTGKQKKKAEKAKLEKEGHIKTLYRNDNLILWEVGSKEGAIFLGRGTKWCTNSKDTSFYNCYSNVPLYVIKAADNKKYQCCFAIGEYRNSEDEPIEIEALLTAHPEIIVFLLSEPLNMAEPFLITHQQHKLGPTSLAIACAALPEFYNQLPKNKKTEALDSRIQSLKEKNSSWDDQDIAESWPAENMTEQEIIMEVQAMTFEKRIQTFESYPEATKCIFHLLDAKNRLEVATYAPEVIVTFWSSAKYEERNAVIKHSPERLIDVIDKLTEAEKLHALSLSGELIQYLCHKATPVQRLTALRNDGENIQYLLHDMTPDERLVAIRSAPDTIRFFYPQANAQEKAEALVKSPYLCTLFSKSLPVSLRQELEYGHWEGAFSYFWEIDACEELKLIIKLLLKHALPELKNSIPATKTRRRSADIQKSMLKICGVANTAKLGRFNFWQQRFPCHFSDDVILGELKQDLTLLNQCEWVERVLQNKRLAREVSRIVLQEGQCFIGSSECPESLISAFDWILNEAQIKLPKWMRLY